MEYKTVALLKEVDFGTEDHGWFIPYITIDFGGKIIGLPYGLSGEHGLSFIKGILDLCNVDKISKCARTIINLVSDKEYIHECSDIKRLEPLPFSYGKPFDLWQWRKEGEKE